MKRKIKVIVENTKDGFSAYVDNDNMAVGTVGDTITELKKNMLEAINLHMEFHKLSTIKQSDITYSFNLSGFFQQYKMINAKALAERTGMQQSLLAQYTTGRKLPGEAQVERIYKTVRAIGLELMSVQFHTRSSRGSAPGSIGSRNKKQRQSETGRSKVTRSKVSHSVKKHK